jgi:hypothetical protein
VFGENLASVGVHLPLIQGSFGCRSIAPRIEPYLADWRRVVIMPEGWKKRSREANLAVAFGISGAIILGAQTNWPVASVCIGALILLVSIYINFMKPWWRNYRVKHPGKIHLLITAAHLADIHYAKQNDQEHRIKELVLPAHREAYVQLLMPSPKITLHLTGLSFGFQGNNNEKPEPLKYAPLFMPGRERIPKGPEGDQIDFHRYYQMKVDSWINQREPYTIGFLVQTKDPGAFRAELILRSTEGVAYSFYKVKVESSPFSSMICIDHRNCLILALLTSDFTPAIAEEILFATRAFMRRLATDAPGVSSDEQPS